jgi:membrane fusion protein (multidrug efflux system)
MKKLAGRYATGISGRLTALAFLLLSAGALAQVPPVELATVDRRDIVETLRLSGSLTSPKSARLSPDVEGRLVRIDVEAGVRVKTGEVLFRLDDELARLELAQAVASEHEAEADLANAKRRVVEVRELVSKKTFPESEARNLEAEVQRLQATLERRQAERAYAAATLERYSYRAPFGGVIAERNADLGERVDTNTDVLLLIATDRLRLDLRVPQQYFGRIDTGTPVRISLDALGGKTIETEVARVVPVSDPDARTFMVRANIDNSAGQLAPGMSVSAQLRIGTERRAEVIPRDALIRYPDGRTTVWVAAVDNDRNLVSERLVKTGLGFDGVIEVLEGVAEGERVVVRGNESLREGQQVRIRE